MVGHEIMWYVYVLKSKEKKFRYIGSSNDLNRRLEQHNAGKVKATKPYKPYEIVAFFGLKDKTKAISFERYLKSGSGAAFLKKRLL